MQVTNNIDIRLLMRENHTSCTSYYIQKLHELLTLMKNDNTILGNMLDYFIIIEFKNKGNQHDHGL